MKTCLRPLIAVALAGILTSAAANPVTTQSHASIQAVAEAHVLANAEQFATSPLVEAGELDSRLTLSQCSEPLEAFDPPGGLSDGKGVVGVRCSGERPWKLYVPVHVSLPGKVVTAASAIRRGEIITEAHLNRQSKDLSKLHRAYFLEPGKLIGSQAKRSIAPGKVITPAMVDTARLVKRGSAVRILSASPLVQVQMKGKAMASGGTGDQIRVKNSHSGRVVSATVVGPGVVRVIN